MTYSYSVRSDKTYPYVFLVAFFFTIVLEMGLPGQIYIKVLIFAPILIPLFIHFTFKIEKNYVTYQMFIMKKSVYKKAAESGQIHQIKFKHYGWATKGAVIQLKKGKNVRIIDFKPEEVYKDIVDFAKENNIRIEKIRDYKILEKLG